MEFGTTQPSCINDTLILTCRINSSLADFIEWNVTLGNLTPNTNIFRFSTGNHSVGDMIMHFKGQVIAKLTDNDTILASNLTIFPPLNNFTHSNINNTIIRCSVGNSNESNTTSVDTRIILEGEELKMYLITIFLNKHFENVVDSRNIFPLSIVQVYFHLLPT